MKNVFITGTSSGFGYLTAKTLVARGHTVFATMRGRFSKNEAKADELVAAAEGQPGRLFAFDCDVTSDASVAKAVRRAMDETGAIDVVVNNAGIGNSGLTETFTPAAMQALFDVNVVGAQRVNRAALIHMRDQGHGLLVHVTSTLGRFVFPYCGVYVASKFALEGLAEAYRYELAPFGVDSTIVEPGGFATAFFESMTKPDDEGRVHTYGLDKKAPDDFWASAFTNLPATNPTDPQMVADAIANLIETPAGQRPLRTIVDPNYEHWPRWVNEAQGTAQREMFERLGLTERLRGPGQ